MEDVLVRTPARARFPALPAALFLATIATTALLGGVAFSAALVAILGTHEMGHYVLARRHRVDSSLPYFIPIPFGFGTLGAVIRIRSRLPSRRATLDIGAAGPLAGVLVAVPLLAWGCAHSEVRAVDLASQAHAAAAPFGMLRDWLAGRAAPAAAGTGPMVLGDSLLTLAVERLVLGSRPPGTDVFLHPVALAAWLGLFVTTLNLLPLGQLDGGHVVYAWLGGRRARAIGRVLSAGLLLAGVFVSFSWIVWWALTRFVIRLDHPPALVEEPLSPGRRGIALLSIALFVLTFVPVPVSF
ncbi:site-2 protease family protein [Anaeromyxobacter oryzisoli]|uniref:site-2 protease family protein n=1 Tax=Anaeromyxobacter oryzisoli TaxID=2925408 RepID=UPI001F55C5B6|nr:site-2 protease family protein [Anaeromyxobacter sp. SG63]